MTLGLAWTYELAPAGWIEQEDRLAGLDSPRMPSVSVASIASLRETMHNGITQLPLAGR
jgi:hypothetical protein